MHTDRKPGTNITNRVNNARNSIKSPPPRKTPRNSIKSPTPPNISKPNGLKSASQPPAAAKNNKTGKVAPVTGTVL